MNYNTILPPGVQDRAYSRGSPGFVNKKQPMPPTIKQTFTMQQELDEYQKKLEMIFDKADLNQNQTIDR